MEKRLKSGNVPNGERYHVVTSFFFTLLENMEKERIYNFLKLERIFKRKKVNLH
jgi:Ulp1 family protease